MRLKRGVSRPEEGLGKAKIKASWTVVVPQAQQISQWRVKWVILREKWHVSRGLLGKTDEKWLIGVGRPLPRY